ncbi:MAG: bifunctional homocysteine S-methyltransferase/methylenetetrahydrofolate reductase [Candidatus Kapaibacteriales bacterium]
MDFRTKLKKQPILFDGGFGTELYNRGVFLNKCFDAINLSDSALVKSIHKDYFDAGADIIETNTYGANRLKLSTYGIADQVYAINYQGAKLARAITGNEAYVAGSIGPLGVQIEPLGKLGKNEAEEIFQEQAKALADGGVDLFVCETFIYADELEIAVNAVKKVSKLPIVAMMTIDESCQSLTGASPEVMIMRLNRLDVDAIGVNSTAGPQAMLEWLEQIRPLTNKKIAILPSAGKPRNVDGRNMYITSPDYMGEYTKHFIESGASIVGGCNGTTPSHISKMRDMLDHIKPHISKKKRLKTQIDFDRSNQPLPSAERSELAKKMSEGKFVKFVELLPPRGVDASKEIEKSAELGKLGVDVINIPDGPRASSRMSASALAIKIQNEAKIESVLHFVCRDKNVIGMQSDLLGNFALGLKNILAITGDPPKLGNYPDATAVFDVDAIGLVNILDRLNHAQDIAGNPIGQNTGFFIGVGANPGAIDLDYEISRLEWKAKAGAEYVITQPVFDSNVFERFVERTAHIGIPIVAGIWPLVSIRNALFMNNEVPGVDVPEDILERMQKREGDKEGGIQEGIDISLETLEKIKGKIVGMQISAPFGRIDPVKRIIEESGL